GRGARDGRGERDEGDELGVVEAGDAEATTGRERREGRRRAAEGVELGEGAPDRHHELAGAAGRAPAGRGAHAERDAQRTRQAGRMAEAPAQAGEGATQRRLRPAETAGGAGDALLGEEGVERVEELERDMFFTHVLNELMCIDSMT